MTSVSDWQIPAELQPEDDYYDFNLSEVLKSVASLRAEIPSDAFSAETMGRVMLSILGRDKCSPLVI
jgi:hypothetical protein